MKAKLNFNTTIGLLAMLVSLGTLFVLIYQSKLMREHEEKSAVPKLELWNDLSEERYGLSIFNKGLGPAIIEKVDVRFEEQDFSMDPMQFSFKYTDSLELNVYFSGSSLYEGIIIQPGQKIRLVRSSDSVSTEVIKDLFYYYEKKRAKLVVHYSSIYGKVWKLDGTGDLANIQSDFEPRVFNELFKE